jgi:long-chain acyl-CoA synthetase
VLPLSHIFERMAGHYLMFHCGVSIYYAGSIQTVARDFADVAPNVLLAVPRIFEKIYARVRDAVSASSLLKRLIFRWATGVGRRRMPYLLAGDRPGLWLRLLGRIADRLVFARIRARTGGNLRFAISGGAPLGPRILEFFWAMGVPIYEGYGLTETSPVLTLNRPGMIKPGCVGHPLLDTWDGKPFLKLSEDGEILCRGPNVMVGYWRDEAATREAIDAEGYFHT